MINNSQFPSAGASTREVMSSSNVQLIDQFLKWYNNNSTEHQVELAEFVGCFCYHSLFTRCTSDDAKIFAFKEYLGSKKNLEGEALKILRFIDDIIQFILEINESAENHFFNCNELILELPGITSLYSIINQLPERSRKWSFTNLQWQRFKAGYSFSPRYSLPGNAVDDLMNALQPHPSIIVN